MASYLESYGATEEQRTKKRKRLKNNILVAICVIVVGVSAYALFKNYRQERVGKEFLSALRGHQYEHAYAMFGCTPRNPCRDYAISKFMEDWGPQSEHPDASGARLGMSQSCGAGVLLRIDYPKGTPVLLNVTRDPKLNNYVIAFAPSDWTECPGRHWHFGAFVRSLFHH